jgi:hypothetical protein
MASNVVMFTPGAMTVCPTALVLLEENKDMGVREIRRLVHVLPFRLLSETINKLIN